MLRSTVVNAALRPMMGMDEPSAPVPAHGAAAVPEASMIPSSDIPQAVSLIRNGCRFVIPYSLCTYHYLPWCILWQPPYYTYSFQCCNSFIVNTYICQTYQQLKWLQVQRHINRYIVVWCAVSVLPLHDICVYLIYVTMY